MYYYLYKVTNLDSNKIYIGVHKTKNLNDGYMGSGSELLNDIKTFGVDRFSKEILEFFQNSRQMFLREEEMVNFEFLKRPDVYNKRVGGRGGFDFINSKEDQSWRSEAAKKTTKIFNSRFKSDPNYRKEYSEKRASIAKQIIENPNNLFGKYPGFTGKKHTPESLEKMRTVKKGTQQGKENSQYGTIWITNGTVNKKILREELIEWKSKGWSPGRVLK